MIVIYPLANDQRHHARIVIRHFTDTLAHDFCPQTLVSAPLLELFVFAQSFIASDCQGIHRVRLVA